MDMVGVLQQRLEEDKVRLLNNLDQMCSEDQVGYVMHIMVYAQASNQSNNQCFAFEFE